MDTLSPVERAWVQFGLNITFHILFPLIFAILMAGAILAYVVLDGFDLGVGMLMPGASAREQELMVASIGPFWDANETWLVMGVGLLLEGFPLAHGVVLEALYLPVDAMLIGLMALPGAGLACGVLVWRNLGRLARGEPCAEWTPFAGAVGIFFVAFAGLAHSLFPYVVMDRITIWEAAAHPSALKVVLIGVAVVVPFIIGYSAFAYQVFLGKVTKGLYE